MTEPKGYLAIVLHAHLPYVRHPEHERFLEERWFYETVSETYLPLIAVFRSLIREKVRFRITFSLSPTLLSMMADPLLQDRCLEYLDRLIELAEKEKVRTKNDGSLFSLASMYHERFKEARRIFYTDYRQNLIEAFRELGKSGSVEFMTCAATHGYLPLLALQPEAVRAQIRVAVETHERFLGAKPSGIWLPECGYYPGVDPILKEEGLRYFIVDTHGILYGTPRPKYGTFMPVRCPSGVTVFGRDAETSKSVWSAEEGYPGDFDYREFYRDIGFDLDIEYLKSYLNGDGSRVNTGIKYYRITGKTDHKELYVPEAANRKVLEHAGNFMFNRERQIDYVQGLIGRAPLIVAPYDAELFGHWWFEGPRWIEHLFRKIQSEQSVFRTLTPSEYLAHRDVLQTATPCASSWGYNGYSEVWLNDSNDWVYRDLHQAAERMVDCANRHARAQGILKRALNQMARELLLAQSSDWAFMMKTGAHSAYAVKRTRDHLERFTRIWSRVVKKSIDTPYLESIESMDNIFPDIDYRVYASHPIEEA
jgi:1,4-alpha-glucan branching enzyme